MFTHKSIYSFKDGRVIDLQMKQMVDMYTAKISSFSSTIRNKSIIGNQTTNNNEQSDFSSANKWISLSTSMVTVNWIGSKMIFDLFSTFNLFYLHFKVFQWDSRLLQLSIFEITFFLYSRLTQEVSNENFVFMVESFIHVWRVCSLTG